MRRPRSRARAVGGEPPQWRQVLEVAVWWGVLFCLWLLFASGAAPAEVGAGVVGAGIAAAIAVLAFRAMRVHFVPRPAWALALRRLPLQLVRDTWLVCSTLPRAVAGRPQRGGYTTIAASTGGGSPMAETRRALLTNLLSLPPNTIVVSFGEDGKEMLVHQLVRRAEEVPELR